jgi:hypothetical protein
VAIGFICSGKWLWLSIQFFNFESIPGSVIKQIICSSFYPCIGLIVTLYYAMSVFIRISIVYC